MQTCSCACQRESSDTLLGRDDDHHSKNARILPRMLLCLSCSQLIILRSVDLSSNMICWQCPKVVSLPVSVCSHRTLPFSLCGAPTTWSFPSGLILKGLARTPRISSFRFLSPIADRSELPRSCRTGPDLSRYTHSPRSSCPRYQPWTTDLVRIPRPVNIGLPGRARRRTGVLPPGLRGSLLIRISSSPAIPQICACFLLFIAILSRAPWDRRRPF